MLKAIQQEVTIQPGGIITLHSPELQSGLRANVIVILTETTPLAKPPNEVRQTTEVQPTLRELLENVATEKERMTLTYRKKLFLAVVPIEDVEVIKQLEHCLDDYSPLETFRVDDALGDFLNTAENAHFVVTYQNKVFLAVVPIEDVYLIEELEECIDRADANDARQEAFNTGTISSEQLDKELTPGRYVGLAEVEDDFNFNERFACIKEFEIILEQSGKLLKKRLSVYFASNKALAACRINHIEPKVKVKTRPGRLKTKPARSKPKSKTYLLTLLTRPGRLKTKPARSKPKSKTYLLTLLTCQVCFLTWQVWF